MGNILLLFNTLRLVCYTTPLCKISLSISNVDFRVNPTMTKQIVKDKIKNKCKQNFSVKFLTDQVPEMSVYSDSDQCCYTYHGFNIPDWRWVNKPIFMNLIK